MAKNLRTLTREIVIILTAATVIACGGKSVKRGSDEGLPKDIPEDFKEKFEISDKAVPGPSPTPSGFAVEWAPESGSKKSKKKQPSPPKKSNKKKGSPAPEASPSPAPSGLAVLPYRRPAKDPIWLGETTSYEITYFGMAAGDFTIKILPYKYVGGRKAYHIQGIATSSKVFSLFYRLNDMVESYLDYDGLFSDRFHIVLDETKQTRDSLELNDTEKGQSYYWNRWNPKDSEKRETKGFFPMEPLSQDSLSALYYIRCLPLKIGEVYEFPVMNEGKNWTAVATVLKHEMLDTPFGRVRTIVVKPETKYQGNLQKRGDSFIWLTDDDRHIVVRLEAKVKIGTVVARLKSVDAGTNPAPEATPSPPGAAPTGSPSSAGSSDAP